MKGRSMNKKRNKGIQIHHLSDSHHPSGSSSHPSQKKKEKGEVNAFPNTNTSFPEPKGPKNTDTPRLNSK